MSAAAATTSEAEDDRRWAAAAQRGSVDAFDRIARRHQGPLLRFLRRRMGDAADAEDVCQETLVRAYRKIGSYDPRWRLSTWLFTIAVRQAATHRRKLRLPPAGDARRDEAAGPASDGPHALVERDEDRQAIWSAARRHLRPEQFDALWMFYVEDLPVQDVARVLGRSRLTTKVLIHRARQKLKPHLEPDGT